MTETHPTTLDEAREAKALALQQLGVHPIVGGIGIASSASGYCVKVNLTRVPSAEDTLPEHIAGVPVRYQVVGTLRKRL